MASQWCQMVQKYSMFYEARGQFSNRVSLELDAKSYKINSFQKIHGRSADL